MGGGNATALGLLRATLDHIVAQQLPSGNFPTEYYNATQDFLVQWDHGARTAPSTAAAASTVAATLASRAGAPGVSAALLAAASAFDAPSYRAAAERALDCVGAAPSTRFQ